MKKPNLIILQVGQLIWATVEELQMGNDLLVNYQGDLLRVHNQSHAEFRAGQRVRLEVMATVPLEFRLRPVSSHHARLDVEI